MTTRAILRDIVATAALFALVFTLLGLAIGNYTVRGQSMEPNYHEMQRLLVDKVSPRLFGYGRGDIVVMRLPAEGSQFIKRLIGKPGDTIELRRNRVFVNGMPLREPYLPPGAHSGPTGESTAWTLGEDEYFLIGDNRSFSHDSREFGPMKSDDLIGRALLLYWPAGDLRVVAHYPHP